MAPKLQSLCTIRTVSFQDERIVVVVVVVASFGQASRDTQTFMDKKMMKKCGKITVGTTSIV